MAIEHMPVEVRLRTKLTELLGPEEADTLMLRPPGGWESVATKDDVETLRLRTEARFDAIDARFDGVDARFVAIDARFDGVDARFVAIDARFDAIETTMEAGFRATRDAWRGEIADGFRTQTWRLVGALTALGALIVAAGRL